MVSPVAPSSGEGSDDILYRFRVTLGDRWCLHPEGSVEVVHVDHLAQVDRTARSWISKRRHVPIDSFGLSLEFAMPSADAWKSRRPTPTWWLPQH